MTTTHLHPWTDTFDPGRKSPPSLKEYLKENADYPVRMISDRLKIRDGDPEQLAVGEGAIMEHDGKRVAAYRDDKGRLHLHSAICPHLGCIVAWNDVEQTWDCPCHGSRFEARGQVIERARRSRALKPFHSTHANPMSFSFLDETPPEAPPHGEEERFVTAFQGAHPEFTITDIRKALRHCALDLALSGPRERLLALVHQALAER